MNYQADKLYFCDRSSWGILQFTGEERIRYLHNQSTNNFNSLKPGQGCHTVFVTSTARTIDLATTYLTEDAILAIVSPKRRQQLFKWLDGFIFPFDKVKLTDISEQFALITLIGTKSHDLIQKLFALNLQEKPEGTHQLATYQDITLRIAVGSDLALPGYNLIIPQENSATIYSLLKEHHVFEMDSDTWEQLRILQGRPAPDKELTEDYNPLEAGLWQTISFDKGCYIGQETIARLNTYNGVKQKLWGVKLDRPVSPKTPVIVEEKKVGVLTSYTETDTSSFGLAYVRTKAGGAGLTVTIGDATGELVTVPFLTYSLG
jgi:tRNA-modifying protein YgfZ